MADAYKIDFPSITKNQVKYLDLIENYIYIYHLGEGGEFAVIPNYPDTINDNQGANFQSPTPLARTAPIYSFQSAGPRAVNFTFTFHRDHFDNVNTGVSNLKIDNLSNDDYIDTLIKKLQAVCVPNYNNTTKMINPPQAAIRIGNDFFIKGVVTSGVNVTWQPPILEGNKYARCTLGFTISEVDPYDADTIAKEGSFRGITRTFKEILKTN